MIFSGAFIFCNYAYTTLVQYIFLMKHVSTYTQFNKGQAKGMQLINYVNITMYSRKIEADEVIMLGTIQLIWGFHEWCSKKARTRQIAVWRGWNFWQGMKNFWPLVVSNPKSCILWRKGFCMLLANLRWLLYQTINAIYGKFQKQWKFKQDAFNYSYWQY